MPNRGRTVWLAVLMCLLPILVSSNDCGEPLQATSESEDIKSPGYPDSYPPNQDCSWTLSAPISKLIEIKVEHVKMSHKDDILILSLDDKISKLHHICASTKSTKCSEIPTTAKSFTLKFRSGSQNSTIENGTFWLRYKLFDPKMCETPQTPTRGFITGTNYSINASIKYQCFPPYDLVGSVEADCKYQLSSSGPQWSNGPPRCLVLDCPKEKNIKRRAGKGAIANPGYPDNYVKGNQNCKWTISAKEGYRIILNFQYFSLPELHIIQGREYNFLDIFEGNTDKKIKRLIGNTNPPNVTSRRNALTLVLTTDNLADQTAKANGFYIDYASIPVTCPNPGIPRNGKRIGELFSYNKTVEYLCEEGYDLIGDPEIKCLDNGQWSNSRPLCQQLTINDSSTPLTSEITVLSTDILTTIENKAEILESQSSKGEEESVTDPLDGSTSNSPNHVVIIVAVVIPTIVFVILLSVYLYYRKKHPVRMLFGRRFSTFENPMYSRAPTAAPKLQL